LNFHVIISPRAEREFEDQLLYLAERSPQGANDWALEFEKAIIILGDAPNRHGFAPENSDHEQEIRQILFKTRRGNPYRLLYTIAGKRVLVLTLRGLGQDFTEFD